TGLAFVRLVTARVWYLVRFYPEKKAAEHFFNALVVGDTQLAYQIWKPQGSSYSYSDFLDDWGPSGYYGPIKSYRIESAQAPPRGGRDRKSTRLNSSHGSVSS